MSYHKKAYFFIFYLLLITICPVKSQGESTTPLSFSGFKPITNYTPGKYNLLPQNLGITQDHRGVIYIANQGGILEFDSNSFRIIEPPGVVTSSLCIDKNGTLFAGGNNEAGFLQPGQKGQLNYVSLTPYLQNEDRHFSYVYQTLCTDSGVWFRTVSKLLRWHNNTFTVWNSALKDNSFKSIFIWNNQLFVQQQGVGLLKFNGDTFKPQEGSDIFGESLQKIYLAVPYDAENLLIGTRPLGLVLYNGETFKTFHNDAESYLKKHSLYYGIRLRNNDFALATLTGGVVIIDPKGHLKAIYTSFSGLQDDNIKFLFEDNQGHLWLAMNQGISRIDYTSPITFFDQRNNLKGLILSITHHKKKLYVGTSNGLFSLAPSIAGKEQKFDSIPDFRGNCWQLLSVGNELLVATREGVFQWNNKTRPIVTGAPAFALCDSHRFPGRVWAGTDRQLFILKKNRNQWETEHRFPQIQQTSIRFMEEDQKGTLWLCTQSHGVIKLSFPKDLRNPTVTIYSGKDGLPTGGIRVNTIRGQAIFTTNSGIYRYDEEQQRFLPDFMLGKSFTGGANDVFRLNQDYKGDIWFHSARHNYHAIRQADNTYMVNDTPFRTLPTAQANALHSWENTFWIGDTNGLILYDRQIPADFDLPFNTIIREIKTGEDTLVYGGTETLVKNSPAASELEIDYENNNIQFQVAAVYFKDSEKTNYQYFMKGYDKGWSQWTSFANKEYSNINPGYYRFHVRAQNVYGTISEEAVLSFRVLSPWYLTWWAFLIYIFLAVLIVVQIVKWRSLKLIREKLRLEQIIEKRTHQINQANVQLQEKTHQLEEQSEKLKELDKIKSRFFANISHEFRTPLTLILGPLDKIRTDFCKKHPELEKEIEMICRNAHRLLSLINQLLDLSKFESGKMALRAEELDIVSFLRGILEPFSTLATELKISLSLNSLLPSLMLYFDPDKMEKVIANLISNALKFTPSHGEILIDLGVSNHAGEALKSLPFDNGYIEIKVLDNGKGIPEDQLNYIFDRFYQADVTDESHRKGSGIGLALVKEMVALHHGTIEVRSRVGENSGTCFYIHLPLGNAHLTEKEIARTPLKKEDQKEDAISYLSCSDLSAENNDNEKSNEPFSQETLFQSIHDKNSAGKPIVLIVEDNADLRHYIRLSLESHYVIYEAKNGKEGIEKALKLIPDLIISDIMMPETDGFELCRKIKSDLATSHIPVILLTARASEESIVEGLQGGADDYITKPFNPRVLAARIHNLIDLRHQLQLKLNRQMVFQPSRIEISDIDREFLKDLQDVIEKNLSDSDFNVEDLSKRLYMSRTTVYRKIQALSGETPTDFIRSYRLMRAAQLLKSQFGSVTEVAFEVGFSSRAYFTKCFKEKFHQLPSEYVSSKPLDS